MNLCSGGSGGGYWDPAAGSPGMLVRLALSSHLDLSGFPSHPVKRGPGIQHEENWECLGGLSKETSLVASRLGNTDLFLLCVSVLLPGVSDRSEFASDYSLPLAAVI